MNQQRFELLDTMLAPSVGVGQDCVFLRTTTPATRVRQYEEIKPTRRRLSLPVIPCFSSRTA